ncbi:MAG: LUD domain-containing protein [Planctomycetaceae bacterium]
MSTAREAIFKRLRTALPQSSPLPELPAEGPWQTFDDRYSRFSEVLEFVGGTAVRVATVAEANTHLQAHPKWNESTVRCSVVEGLGDSTFDLNAVEDPHLLENVGFAVLKGHFGVAENGAVWVTDNTVKHRVLYFIPQYIAIAIPSVSLVNNMHEAYTKISAKDHAFAGFISGPSKTADIEQSLVIGAHGARALTVYLIDEWPAEK